MPISNLNWTNLDGFYSQLTGVLSGFIFAALTLLLTSSTNRSQLKSDRAVFSATLYTLLIVFFGLILSSFLYAATTGDVYLSDRAAYRTIVVSLAFAISASLMFVSLSWLFTVYGIDSDILRYTHILARVITTAAGFFLILYVTHAGPENDPFRHHHLVQLRPWLIWSALYIPVLGWFCRLVFRKSLTSSAMTLQRVVSLAATLIFLICIFFGCVSDFPEAYFAHFSLCIAKYASLILLGIFLYFCGIALPDVSTGASQTKIPVLDFIRPQTTATDEDEASRHMNETGGSVNNGAIVDRADLP